MCKQEFDAMQEALENYGEESSQYLEALGRYLRCYGQLMRARDSHAAGWDERLYQLHKEILQAWEQLVGKLKVPPRPICGVKSIEVRSKILANRKNAMIFSDKLEEAYKKTGIKLDDDETYTCFVCVVKKPQYVSQALALDPLGQNMDGAPNINYIFEPAIMASVIDRIEKDKINYESKNKEMK